MPQTTARERRAASPLFSVCIPAYEDAQALSRCLESVCGQTMADIEIIVSDDSQTDAVARAVEKQNDARIRYKRNTPALGAPANWNAALHMSVGLRVTLLHQDDWYRTPEALAEVSARMDEHNADVVISGRALYNAGRCLGEYRLPSNAAARFLSGFPAISLVVNRLGHPGVFFFSGRYRDIPYDERLLYFSDTDYYYRLLKTADRVLVYPEPIVGISWQKTSRLSTICLADPQKTLSELFLLHEKYDCTPVEQGISAAGLCVSLLRHWHRSLGLVLQTLWRGMPRAAFFAACASMPFFSLFLVYRLAYRLVRKKGWA